MKEKNLINKRQAINVLKLVSIKTLRVYNKYCWFEDWVTSVMSVTISFLTLKKRYFYSPLGDYYLEEIHHFSDQQQQVEWNKKMIFIMFIIRKI